MNPGDYASRGTTDEALMTCQRCIMGPEFLWKPEEDWPQDPSLLVTISEGDREVKSDGKVFLASISESVHPLVEYFYRTSSWHRLTKSVAWLLQ